MLYLKSGAVEAHAQAAGCIFLADSTQRANVGEAAIPVENYTPKATFPSGGKVTVNGSTSMEKFIKEAMSGYAKLYGRTADEIFDLDLKSSSVGRTAVHNDKNGSVIGLSSASVKEDGINSFNVCLDAVAVIVNKSNESISDLTLAQLYDIYSGKITKFSAIVG